MEGKFTMSFCLLLLFITLTAVDSGQQFTTGQFYNVIEDHILEGDPIKEVLVRSKLQCAVQCQMTPDCEATMIKNHDNKQTCQMFDKNVAVRKQSSNESCQTMMKGE